MATNPTQNEQGDWVCEHGTAMDVHCCGCHSGFLFFPADECTCLTLTEQAEVAEVQDGGLINGCGRFKAQRGTTK